MKCELFQYNKESGQMTRIASGSSAAMRSEMNVRNALQKKGPAFMVYTAGGQLVASTMSGGANPNTWGPNRDARKKGEGRKNIHCRDRKVS